MKTVFLGSYFPGEFFNPQGCGGSKGECKHRDVAKEDESVERILLMMAAARAADAEEALRSAAHNAVAPRRISYALSLLEEPSEMEIAALRRLGACQFLVPAADPWMDFQELWQGENYLLVGCPQMRFVHHWDLQLLRELRACQPGSDTPACVLTGYRPRPEDPVDAVCPVAVEGFDEGGRICFHRGTPLRYARQSQRCAFLHPRFCFGPAAFFQQVAHSQGPRFLAAFQQRWDLYTLRQALMHLTWDDPLPPCPVEGEERVLQRFEKRFGLRLDTRQLSPMARLGLTSPELTFPTCVPLPVKWQEAVHRLLCRNNQSRPMCATAYINLPVAPPNLPEEYLCWFHYLSRIRAIPMTCYAEGDKLRQLTGQYPNLLEYKRRYALPLECALRPEEALNYLRLSRVFLLRKTREKYPNQTHYVWVDFGYQRYPVYEGAAVNWDAVCQETICLAMVGGMPDTSMIVVPAGRLDAVCQETLALCQAALEAGESLPWEQDLWLQMMQAHPDWFTPVELPGPRELLGLTMLSREEEFHVLA